MKILIIKQGALGDLILASPIIRRLQTHHGNDELWLLTTPPYAAIIHHFHDGKKYKAAAHFDCWEGLKVKAFPRKGVINTLRTLSWLRRHRFHRIYDLQSNDRSRGLVLFAGARERVGNHAHYPYTHSPPEPYTGQCHVFDRLNQILASANVAPAPPRPSLPMSYGAVNHVAAWLAAKGLTDKKLVVLHAGASARHPAKRWPGFRELALMLNNEGFQIIWAGAADDAELNRNLSREAGIDATGEFNVLQLIALGRRASFAVTNDSAPMHILSCSGIPVFALFGPTDWRRNYALGQKDRVITLDRAPERKLCDPESMKLERIPPDMVLERIKNENLV